MWRLLRFALRIVLSAGFVAALVGGYGYYRYAAAHLPLPPDAVRRIGLTRGTPSLTGSGLLPFTFEAEYKRKGHNWLRSRSGEIGLVSGRLEWSAEQGWVEDSAFRSRQAAEVDERKARARRTVPRLVEDLRSDDAAYREIASVELVRRTGLDLGYRYDAPDDERAQAAARWEAWLQSQQAQAAGPPPAVAPASPPRAAPPRDPEVERTLEILGEYDRRARTGASTTTPR